jgi:glycosyltransferase involved in cell wall biosynthesis
MDHKPIRILYIIGQLNIGGAERQLLYLASHLNRDEFQPVICTLSDQTQQRYLAEKADIDVITLPRLMKPDLTRLWRLPAVIRNIQPDLIHSYLFVGNFWARISGTFSGIPVIISIRNSDYYTSPFQVSMNRILRPLTKMMIANSKAGRNSAISRREIGKRKSLVIYNGIPLFQFDDLLRKGDVRKELGLNKENILIGMIARLESQKDYETYLRAMQIVSNKNEKVRVLCVGDGSKKSELMELTRSLNISQITIFTGSRSDVPSILNALDIFVLSSHFEGFPNAIMEAMAAGLPVVASRVGGVPELVAHNITGLLVSPGNAEDLAESVLSLLEDQERATEMGLRGRQRIESSYTIENLVAQTEAVYNQVLRTK